MFPGKPRDNEIKERFAMQLPASLKQEIEVFASGRGITLSDVARVSSEALINGYLPVIGSIPCGPLREVLDEEVYYELVPPFMRPRKGDFLLESSGDSMAPKIEARDLVLLRPGLEVSSGEICAVQIYKSAEDRSIARATLKKVHMDYKAKTVTLKPINPDFPEETFDIDQVEILAVCRGLIKKEFH